MSKTIVNEYPHNKTAFSMNIKKTNSADMSLSFYIYFVFGTTLKTDIRSSSISSSKIC